MEHCQAGGREEQGADAVLAEEVPAADLPSTAATLAQRSSALRDARHDAIPAHVASETTQVWHGTHAQQALAAAADGATLPVVEVAASLAGERTVIIRRPVRRKPMDWRAPVRWAASAGVMVTILAMGDWTERHPVLSGAAPVDALPAAARPQNVTPAGPIVEALADATAERGRAAAVERGERTGRRASKLGGPPRGEAGRAATKPRTRPSGVRGARVPPTSNDRRPVEDDAASAGAGSALAHSTRTRAPGGRSSALTSSTWIDPFAAY